MSISNFTLTTDGKLIFKRNDIEYTHVCAEDKKAIFGDNVDIDKDLYVHGNIECDNYLILNTLPEPNKDSGIFIKQHQDDIVSGDAIESGNTISIDGDKVILQNPNYALDDYYKGWHIKVVDNMGNSYIRKIIAYDGINLTVTVDSPIGLVGIAMQYYLFAKLYNGIIYDQNKREIIFVGTGEVSNNNNNGDNMKIYETLDIHAKNARFDGDVEGQMFTTLSDVNLKTSITDLEDDKVMELIDKLEAKEYYWKYPERFNYKKQIGFIAQEVEEILPSIVGTNENGWKSVAYDKIVPILLQGIKVLKKENKKLEERINMLEERIE